MNAARLAKRIEALFAELPDGSAAKEQAGTDLTYELLKAEGEARFGAAKNATQDALNGTATPQLGGVLASGSSGVAGPMTTGVMSDTPGGNSGPGSRLPVAGGQSPYTIPAEAGMSGGAGPASGQESPARSLLEAVQARGGNQPLSLAGTVDPVTLALVANGGQAYKALVEADEKVRFVKQLEGELADAERAGHPTRVAALKYDLAVARLAADESVRQASDLTLHAMRGAR